MNEIFTVSQLEAQNEMRINSAYNQVVNMRAQAAQISSKLDGVITFINILENQDIEGLRNKIITENDILSDEVE